MGLKVNQFIVLLCKHILVQGRRPLEILTLILLPLLICMLLVLSRNFVGKAPNFIPAKTYKAVSMEDFFETYKNGSNSIDILYSPENCQLCDQSIKFIQNSNLSCGVNVTLKNFKNSWDMEKYLQGSDESLGAIQFHDGFRDNKETIGAYDAIKIIFRFKPIFHTKNSNQLMLNGNKIWNWQTQRILKNRYLDADEDPNDETGDILGYYKEGVAALIYLTVHAFYNWKSKTSTPPNEPYDLTKYRIQRFSEIEHSHDAFLHEAKDFISVCVAMAFLPFVCFCIRHITAERYMKELFRNSGMNKFIYWSSWYFYLLACTSVLSALIILTLKQTFSNVQYVPALLPNANIFILALLMLLYSCNCISYMFFISCIFTEASTAAIIGILIFFLTCLPHVFFLFENAMSIVFLVICSLFFNVAFGIGFKLMYALEVNNQGVSFHNVHKFFILNPNCTMVFVLLMLALDAALLLVLALYIEEVFPGKYGWPKRWDFCIRNLFKRQRVNLPFDDFVADKNFESEPNNLNSWIKLRNVRKTYGKTSVAVANTNVNIFENQITVLIGHNGVGKSTILDLISGMQKATSGDVIIHDVLQKSSVREDLGFNPCTDALYNELSPFEHMLLFGLIRNHIQFSQLKEDVEYIFSRLHLDKESHKILSNLPKATRRKLSVALAFCGGSKIIILDEPTLGLDYSSTVNIWQLVHWLKKSRCIIIATNTMEEAELLSERVVVLKNGHIVGVGTPQFLFDINNIDGYYLTINKKTDCNVNDVTNFLQQFLPVISLKVDQQFVLCYFLHDKFVPKFGDMLLRLEINKERLFIDRFSIRKHNLEDLFMKACVSEKKLTLAKRKYKINKYSHTSSTSQFGALFMKHVIITSRHWEFLVLKFLFPMFVITLYTTFVPLNKTSLPKLKLEHQTFSPRPVIMFGGKDIRHKLYHFGNAIHTGSNGHVNEHFIKMQRKDFVSTKYNVLYGIQSENGGWTCYYNGIVFLHTITLCLTHQMEWTTQPRFSLHPVPFNTSTPIGNMKNYKLEGFFLALSVTVSACILTSLLVVQYSQEKCSGFKQLQLYCGANIFVYWIVAYLWDLVTSTLCMCWILLNIYLALPRIINDYKDVINDYKEMYQIFCILVCFGVTFPPMVYVFSVLFNKTLACLYLLLLTLIISVLPFLFLSKYYEDEIPENIFLSLASPHFTLICNVYNVFVNNKRRKMCHRFVHECGISQKLEDCWSSVCKESKHCCTSSFMDLKRIGKRTSYMFLSALLYIIVLICFDVIFVRICHKKSHRCPREINKFEDEGVLYEKMNVMNFGPDERQKYPIVLENVWKNFRKHQPVLSDINLLADHGSCLGLMGPSGSGKSVIIKLCSKQLEATRGYVWVLGTKAGESKTVIGFNPAARKLCGDFTVYQMILFLTLLRGHKFAGCKNITNALANFMDATPFLNARIEQLDKLDVNKFCNLISIIGDPTIICLDEPTTGMDPLNKLQFWESVSSLKKQEKCVVLASHDMQECDTLCTRMGILEDGELRALGMLRVLKQKYARHILLAIKIATTEVEFYKKQTLNLYVLTIENFIKTKFDNAKLKLNIFGVLFYDVPDYFWPEIFNVMESAKEHLPIEKYIVHHLTLNQVSMLFNE